MHELSLFDLTPETGAAAPARAAGPPGGDRERVEPAGPLLLAVDGNSLAHRAYHAYASRPQGTSYGFLALLCALCERTCPDALLVGFDCRTRSRRKERWPEYKANRPPKDPALVAALAQLPELLDDLGVAVAVADGWEADDVVASAAAACERSRWRCTVATSDRDAYALVSDTTTVLRLGSGLDNAVVVDAARLQRELRLRPGQYLQYAALRGDTSDNLPGIAGVGPAKAAALLSAYGTVEAAVADPIGCRSVLGKQLGQQLIDDVRADESVFARNVAAMAPVRDLPVDLQACRPRLTPEALSERLRAWGLRGLDVRVAVALAAPPQGPPLPRFGTAGAG